MSDDADGNLQQEAHYVYIGMRVVCVCVCVSLYVWTLFTLFDKH